MSEEITDKKLSNVFDFGQVINLLIAGQCVRRVGWNSTKRLWLMPAASVKAEWCREPGLKEMAIDNGGEVQCAPSIRMANYGVVTTGWTPSQEDMFAKDWTIAS